MNIDSVNADLLALPQTAPDDSARPKAASLRAVLPAVETVLAAGTRRENILEALNAHDQLAQQKQNAWDGCRNTQWS